MSFRSIFLGKFLCGAAVVFLPAAAVLCRKASPNQKSPIPNTKSKGS